MTGPRLLRAFPDVLPPMNVLHRGIEPSAGNGGGGSAVGVDHDLDSLELLEVAVAGGRHRTAQGTHEVHGTVAGGCGPVQDRFQAADGADLDAVAAGQFAVVGLAAPVEAAAWRLGGARERGTDHDGVGATGQSLGDVTAAAHAAVGDDVHVAAAGLVEVVAAGGGDVTDGAGHGHGHAEHRAGGVAGTAAEAHEHTRGAGTHQVQGGGVGRATTDDDGHVQVVDELLEVERLGPPGHVLGRDSGPADHEDVHPGVDDRPVVLGGALRRQAGCGDQTGAADLLDPAADELFLDRRGVDLLEARGGGFLVEFADLLEQRGGVLVTGPEPLEIENTEATVTTDRHHRLG